MVCGARSAVQGGAVQDGAMQAARADGASGARGAGQRGQAKSVLVRFTRSMGLSHSGQYKKDGMVSILSGAALPHCVQLSVTCPAILFLTSTVEVLWQADGYLP